MQIPPIKQGVSKRSDFPHEIRWSSCVLQRSKPDEVTREGLDQSLVFCPIGGIPSTTLNGCRSFHRLRTQSMQRGPQTSHCHTGLEKKCMGRVGCKAWCCLRCTQLRAYGNASLHSTSFTRCEKGRVTQCNRF